MASSSDLEHHKLTKFFFIISIFIAGISVLAVYSTIMTTEYSIKKDDIQAESITHLVKSSDWWNDYQAQRNTGINFCVYIVRSMCQNFSTTRNSTHSYNNCGCCWIRRKLYQYATSWK